MKKRYDGVIMWNYECIQLHQDEILYGIQCRNGRGGLAHQSIFSEAKPNAAAPSLPSLSAIFDTPSSLNPSISHVAHTMANQLGENPYLAAPAALGLTAGAMNRASASRSLAASTDRSFQRLFTNGVQYIPANPDRVAYYADSALRNEKMARIYSNGARFLGPAAMVAGSALVAPHIYDNIKQENYVAATGKAVTFGATIAAAASCGTASALAIAPYTIAFGPLGTAIDIGTGLIAGGLCASGMDSMIQPYIAYFNQEAKPAPKR